MKSFYSFKKREPSSFPLLPARRSFQPFSHFTRNRNRYRKNLGACFLFFFLIQVGYGQGIISGKVTDDKGSPLAGVSVQAKGATGGVSTNSQGRYSIVPSDGSDTLVFSSVGFGTQEIAVRGRKIIDVSLVPDAKALSDVVVIGYGKQKKVNLVGSVSAVTVDDKLTSRALPNISSGLEGLVPGLAVTQNSGMAGSNGASLLIRGLGTVNNSSPLIVVDGMPDVDINRVNINDIESVSVLKDATSASVYGSRAANGVILITTKTGKNQRKASITFNSTTALTTPTKGFDFLADYPRALTLEQRRALTNTQYSNLLFKNGTIDQWMALGMIDPVRYPNTDWWNIIMRNGSLQSYNISASGGNEQSNFFSSVGVKNEQGLQINNKYKQYNLRFNFDYKLRPNMNTGIRVNANTSNYVFALAEGFTDSDPTNTAGFDMQYAIAGILPYDPKTGYYGGVMAYGEDPQAYNPYTVYQNNLTRQNRQEANGALYWDWTPVKGLTGSLEYSGNYYNQFQYQANMPNQAYNFQAGGFGSRIYVGSNAGITNDTRTGYKTMFNGRLNYHTLFKKNHDISALVVYSEEYWNDRSQFSSRLNRIYPTLTQVDAALATTQVAGGTASSEGLQSYVGRFNYTGFNKYLFEFDGRIDGSSKFLPGHRYGFFPSVAVGWRFTEENFIRPLSEKFLSSGKLRASYGSLGNNSGVGRYEQQLTLPNYNYYLNNAIALGFVSGKLFNEFLTWESTTVLNLGADLGFLKNRLSASIDYYDRLTTGMNRPSDLSLLLSGAYSAPRTNIGNLRNRGVEADISWKDRVGKVNYGLGLNASYNHTNLEKWNEFLNRGNVFLNMPYHFVYAYQDKGIAQTWQDVYNATPQGAQPGDILREDLNGDGRIDGNDLKAYPNAQRDRPTTYFGFNGYVSWKGFDFAFLLQGSAGRKDFWINAFNNVNFSTTRYAVTQAHLDNPWSVENRDGLWPRLGGSGNNMAETAFWLDNLSYLRLKNMQIGYNLPKTVLRVIHINNLRIAGTAENLATFTSYRGLDPEKAGNNNNLYPINKSYSISVNMNF